MADYANLKAAIDTVIKANGQQEITGTVLNQTLTAMVNSLGAGYLFMGVAIPSINPGTPDQNVFYLAGQAGTYSNFGATTLQAGLSILKWNGTWSSETLFTFDASITQNSANPITSGAVFEKLKLDGGAYDVSAHNNNQTFASLSALLSDANLSTLIPTNIRSGGMSIKFVLTSDNKYVQFRYMLQYENTTAGNNRFKNVANWQGVDTEPQYKSHNLVESGGVAPVKLEVEGGTVVIGSNTTPPTWSGKTIDSSGNIVTATDEYKLTIPIYLHAGEKLRVVQQYSPRYATIIRCDAELTTIYERKTGVNATFTATEDCYVAAHIHTSGTYTISQIYQGLLASVGSMPTLNTAEKTSLVGAINEVNNQAQTITNLQIEVNGGSSVIGTKSNPPTWAGKYVDSNGNVVSGSNQMKLMTPILLRVGDKIRVQQTYVPTYGVIFTCDEGLTIVTRVGNGTNVTYTATSDCYITVQINTESTDFTITQILRGIKDKLGNLGDLSTTSKTDLVTAINEVDGGITELKKSVPHSKALIRGTDYHRTIGYEISQTGQKVVAVSGWISESISVKNGDIIKISSNYNNGVTIVKTNSEQTFYLPILIGCISGREYTVPIDYDGYILLSCSSTDISYTITQVSLPDDEYRMVVASDKNDKQITLNDVESRISDLYSQKRKYQAEHNTAIIKARFDREVMLAEVHAMTEADVLASGSCGYVINNDDVTDVTDGTMTWKIYKNGILYISGYGRMYDYVKGTSACNTINGVNNITTSMMNIDPYNWYYGFLPQNLNGITPPTPPDGYRYRANGDVMVYANKRYVPWGDDVNTFIRDTCGYPSYNKVYGYSAPWFIYRTEIDDSYESDSEYNARNPTKIRYNRICIEEDTQHGGITYIGNWAFYRASADSLILPNAVTKIGCWSIRYSPVLRILSMGNNVTDIEDYGISRMEALEYCELSSSLQNINEYSIAPYYTKYLSLPRTLVNYADYATYGCQGLEYVEFAGSESNPSQIANIGSYAFTLGALSIVDIPEYIAATTIKDSAFYNLKALQIRIPQNITTIENDAFYGNQLAKVIIDSNTVASQVNTSTDATFGYLLANTQVVAIKHGLTVGAYINSRFAYFKTIDGYDIYMRYTYSGKITYEVIS